MDAVGKAAGVVREVRRQLAAKPDILRGEDKPDCGTCVDIVTKAAARDGRSGAPAGGVRCGGCSHQAARSSGSGRSARRHDRDRFVCRDRDDFGGGAWDSAKFIEEGNLGGKGSFAHAASVTGDTVGDPYKDTAGPRSIP
jgi:K(+)-stimulated pyrophosphate-energized sodium pump